MLYPALEQLWKFCWFLILHAIFSVLAFAIHLYHGTMVIHDVAHEQYTALLDQTRQELYGMLLGGLPPRKRRQIEISEEEDNSNKKSTSKQSSSKKSSNSNVTHIDSDSDKENRASLTSKAKEAITSTTYTNFFQFRRKRRSK